MVIKCLLFLLFIFTLFIALMSLSNHNNLVCGGRRKRKRQRRRSRGISREESKPISEKIIEIGLSEYQAEELTKTIVDVLSEYSDNPFIINLKMDIIIKNLDEESLQRIQKDKEEIKVLAEINEGTQEIRSPKEEHAEACSLYECPRCSAHKHTYKEIQKRALDEPTNLVCTCLECGFKWDQD